MVNETGHYGYMSDIFTDDWYQHHPGGESSRLFAESLGSLDYPARDTKKQNMRREDVYRIMTEDLRNAINEAQARGVSVTVERGYYRIYQHGKVVSSFFRSTYLKWSNDYKIKFWLRIGIDV